MPDMKKNFQLIFISLSVFFLLSCSRTYNSFNMNNQETDLGTSSSKFLDQTYISESLDFALYNAWLNLDSALSLKNTSDSEEKYDSHQIQEKIATAQNIFLQELEKEKNLKNSELKTICMELKIKYRIWRRHVKVRMQKNFHVL